jgi:hypothetical protein
LWYARAVWQPLGALCYAKDGEGRDFATIVAQGYTKTLGLETGTAWMKLGQDLETPTELGCTRFSGYYKQSSPTEIFGGSLKGIMLD